MYSSRRAIAWILAAIFFASGLTAAQVACARIADAATPHMDCDDCDHDDSDPGCDDRVCAARVAAAYHALIVVVQLPERTIVRRVPIAVIPEAAPMRSEPPDPPPPRQTRA